jgi:hypothetical protein
LREVQSFIATSAGRVRRGDAFDLETIQFIAAPFETAPLNTSNCAIVHLMLASLLECAPRIGQIERLAIDRGRAF